MRHVLFSAILSTSLLLSYTAAQAQQQDDPFAGLPSAVESQPPAQTKGLDEFEAFRNKLNANRGGTQGSKSIDDEEDADLAPIGEQGQGIKTPEEYLAAANAGDVISMLEIARIYREGADGVSKDNVRALKWYGLAYNTLQSDASKGKQIDRSLEMEATKWRIYLRNNMAKADLDETAKLIDSWRPMTATGDAGGDELMFDGMIIADSEITAVTVFSDRATVTRRSIVNIPEGAQTVVFKNLPLGLLAQSLRAEGKAEAVVKLGAVSLKPVSGRKPATQSPRNVRAILRPLEDQQLLLDAERAALQSKKDFLNRMIQQATTIPTGDHPVPEIKPEQWTAAADKIYTEMAEIEKSFLALQLRAGSLERKMVAAQTVPRQTQAAPRITETNAVLIPLEAMEATKLTLDLSYQVSNATWQPLYDARLSAKGKLEIQQYGNVRQKTGEDWKGVALTLSTARPQRNTSLPEMNTIWLDAYEIRDDVVNSSYMNGAGADLKNKVGAGIEDEVYRKAIEAENAAKAREAAARGGSAIPVPIAPGQYEQLSVPPSQMGAADPLAEWRQKAEARRLSLDVEFSPAQINTGGFVNEYKIAGPARVLSDGFETKLMVGNFETESEMQVHIKPQLSEDAFIVANMKLKGDAPLLPGTVNLFRDGAYLGQTYIPLLRPSEEYALYFGIDDQVSVKRHAAQEEIKEQGMISRDNVAERAYVTEIQNLHAEPVNIVLREMVPTSRNEKAVVFLRKDVTSPGFVADAKNIKGMLHWNFDLKPKEKKEMKVSWTVTWPKDHRLTGL